MNTIAAVPPATPLRAWLMAAFAVTLGGLVTGSAYFAVGGIFALLSDLFALAMGIVGLVVVAGLHAYVAAAGGEAARTVRTIGLVAYAIMIIGSAALVLLNLGVTAVPGGPALAAQFAAVTAQGVWFVGFGLIVLRGYVLPRDVGWMSIATGLGYASLGVAAVIAPGSVAAMAGGFIGIIVNLALVLRLRATVRA